VNNLQTCNAVQEEDEEAEIPMKPHAKMSPGQHFSKKGDRR